MSAFPATSGLARGTFLEMGALGKIRWRRTAHGKKRWFIDLRPYHRIFTLPSAAGQIPIDSKDLAQRVLEDIRGRVARGIPIQDAIASFQRSDSSHVLKHAERWLEARQRDAESGLISPRTFVNNELRVRLHWGRWNSTSVHDVTRMGLEAWVEELRAKGLKGPTVLGCLRDFSGFLRWLQDREVILRVPTFPPISVKTRIPQILGLEERERILAALPEERRGIFFAMSDLALRPNEARALQAIDYDPAGGGWLEIRRGARLQGSGGPTDGTKTGRSRRLPCTQRLAAWIDAHSSRDGRLRQALLFPSLDGRMISHFSLLRYWKAASEAAGVRYVPLREATRHTTATLLRRSGVSLTDVQLLLGHSSSKQTETYVRDQGAALVPLVRPPPR